MSNDLERIITELEETTSRMLDTTCWEQEGGFGELLAARGALSARLTDRQDFDESAANRVAAVIRAGNGLVARVMAMRVSVLAEMAQAETQRRFTHEVGTTVTVPAQTHQLDLNA